MTKITVKGTDIVFYKKSEEDYISLTDIAKIWDQENPYSNRPIDLPNRTTTLNACI